MNSQMKQRGRMGISGALMVIGAAVAITASKWPFRTALFPLSIGICVFLMAIAEFFLELFGRDVSKQDERGAKPDTVDPKTALHRTVAIFAWIFGFFLMIIVLGFTIAVPLMVFLYLKVQSRESWGLSLLLTAATIVFFYGLFVWLIETPFPQGWIVRWVGNMLL